MQHIRTQSAYGRRHTRVRATGVDDIDLRRVMSVLGQLKSARPNLGHMASKYLGFEQQIKRKWLQPGLVHCMNTSIGMNNLPKRTECLITSSQLFRSKRLLIDMTSTRNGETGVEQRINSRDLKPNEATDWIDIPDNTYPR